MSSQNIKFPKTRILECHYADGSIVYKAQYRCLFWYVDFIDYDDWIEQGRPFMLSKQYANELIDGYYYSFELKMLKKLKKKLVSQKVLTE